MRNIMSILHLMEENREKELIAIFRFIDKASPLELARIISEIVVCHDNLLAFNEKIKSLDHVKSVCLNGECIQLNLEYDELELINLIKQNGE